MKFLWLKRKVRKVANGRRLRRRPTSETLHYEAHKERARTLVTLRLEHWNQFYNLAYNRVAIRNQGTRWGSCSTKQNLNFNYRLVFLPIELVDYVIVHELCHLKHFNHSATFWSEVEKTLSDYRERKEKLSHATKIMHEHIYEGRTVTDAHISAISDTVPA